MRVSLSLSIKMMDEFGRQAWCGGQISNNSATYKWVLCGHLFPTWSLQLFFFRYQRTQLFSPHIGMAPPSPRPLNTDANHEPLDQPPTHHQWGWHHLKPRGPSSYRLISKSYARDPSDAVKPEDSHTIDCTPSASTPAPVVNPLPPPSLAPRCSVETSVPPTSRSVPPRLNQGMNPLAGTMGRMSNRPPFDDGDSADEAPVITPPRYRDRSSRLQRPKAPSFPSKMSSPQPAPVKKRTRSPPEEDVDELASEPGSEPSDPETDASSTSAYSPAPARKPRAPRKVAKARQVPVRSSKRTRNPVPKRLRFSTRTSARGRHTCQQDGCTGSFGRRADLTRHLATVHSQGDRSRVQGYACSNCGAVHSRRDSLIRHERLSFCTTSKRRTRRMIDADQD